MVDPHLLIDPHHMVDLHHVVDHLVVDLVLIDLVELYKVVDMLDLDLEEDIIKFILLKFIKECLLIYNHQKHHILVNMK